MLLPFNVIVVKKFKFSSVLSALLSSCQVTPLAGSLRISQLSAGKSLNYLPLGQFCLRQSVGSLSLANQEKQLNGFFEIITLVL